jgi:hypothetical protein
VSIYKESNMKKILIIFHHPMDGKGKFCAICLAVEYVGEEVRAGIDYLVWGMPLWRMMPVPLHLMQFLIPNALA